MVSRTLVDQLLRRARTLSLVIALGFVLPIILAHPHAVAAPVHTHARTQDPQALADFVTEFVRNHTRARHGDAVRIQLDTVRHNLPACDALHATMPKTIRPRSTIAVRCAAPKVWHLMVAVHLSLPGVHITAARTIAPGETLSADDIRAVPADVLRLPADAVTDPAHALGRVATQRIRQGGTIKSGTLRDVKAIQRGQRVHTEARGAGFVMRGAGFALQAGPPGSTIQVRTSSGAVISAVVIDATTVHVSL